MFGFSKTVLIVDDERQLGDTLAAVLKSWGKVATLVAESVPEAIATMEQKSVDLVITDVNMEGHSGYDLIAFLQEKHPHIPVVLISGKVNIYDDHGCSKDHMKHIYAFFEKPFNFSELKQTVHEALSAPKRKKGA